MVERLTLLQLSDITIPCQTHSNFDAFNESHLLMISAEGADGVEMILSVSFRGLSVIRLHHHIDHFIPVIVLFSDALEILGSVLIVNDNRIDSKPFQLNP